MAISPMSDQAQADDNKDGEQAPHPCFLCAFDPCPCTIAHLEGRIIDAYEQRRNGENLPIITIRIGTALVSVALTRYYRSLVKGLTQLGTMLRKSKLTLHVYHLPAPTNSIEQQGRAHYYYNANPYTLAVLEPDTLLNITDLNQAEYCPRQYLLRRLIPSSASAATIRGNFVHHCFKELLKEHVGSEQKNKHNNQDNHQQETPLETLQRHFTQVLEREHIELALNNISVDAMQADVMPHLESLATWYQNEYTTLWTLPINDVLEDNQAEEEGEHSNQNFVRAETFLLAPEIGLRGRLDLLWQQADRQRLLELKTGGAKGPLPKSDHRWQVYGYHALLTARRDSRMKKALAWLLYSGTPGQAEIFGIPFSDRELQRVNETRNILVLSHVTGVPPTPPGPSRCTKCAMLEQCERVSSLLDWQPPVPDLIADASVQAQKDARRVSDTAEERDFFRKYYHLLRLEGSEGEQQQALLWKMSVAERIERGTAIGNLELLEAAKRTEQGEWQQLFRCKNTSELREGDEVLLSDGDPVIGEVVTGTIVHISAEQVDVWSPELISHPKLIDRYGSTIVHTRTLQNLMRWLRADPHLRGLVAGNLRPRFDESSVIASWASRSDFNPEQNLAVERALQMQDYLLIHGPPGTGKTSVIAEIVKRLCQQGQRVLLAAFTNQAVDNMLRRLDQEGFHDYVRLGHDRSVDEQVQPRLLKHLVEANQHRTRAEDSPSITQAEALSDRPLVRELLRTMPVIASTAATWSSETYSPALLSGATGTRGHIEESSLQFDVALIDEAGQLTIPAILGALRFAKRFILVGDEKQLPPLVLSKVAAEAGLAESLFSQLKALDKSYREDHPSEISASVALRTQYRMNKWISHFSSVVFYEGNLTAHTSVADRVLPVKMSEPSAAKETRESPTITKALQPGFPLVFLDVHSEQERESETLKTSDAEARTVRALVAGLLARGIAQQDIGIIAPYRAQVANLRRHLFSDEATTGWLALAPTSPMSIDTVDRFQGGERLVMILSFATLKTPEATSPLRDFLTNPNRLNVALTRAQRKLLLVGSAPALEGLPYFQRLITYCRNMKMLLTI